MKTVISGHEEVNPGKYYLVAAEGCANGTRVAEITIKAEVDLDQLYETGTLNVHMDRDDFLTLLDAAIKADKLQLAKELVYDFSRDLDGDESWSFVYARQAQLIEQAKEAESIPF